MYTNMKTKNDYLKEQGIDLEKDFSTSTYTKIRFAMEEYAKAYHQNENGLKVGDIVKAPNTVYRDDITLYVCYIDGDLLYISDDKNATKDECETSFVEDCYRI
jgi:hypothetical protein